MIELRQNKNGNDKKKNNRVDRWKPFNLNLHRNHIKILKMKIRYAAECIMPKIYIFVEQDFL